MTVKISFCIAAVVLAFPASISTGYSAQPARVLISQIKAHPNRYEVLGILNSRHLGVFLRSRTSDDLIRLRFVLAERSGDIQIVRDSLF